MSKNDHFWTNSGYVSHIPVKRFGCHCPRRNLRHCETLTDKIAQKSTPGKLFELQSCFNTDLEYYASKKNAKKYSNITITFALQQLTHLMRTKFRWSTYFPHLLRLRRLCNFLSTATFFFSTFSVSQELQSLHI